MSRARRGRSRCGRCRARRTCCSSCSTTSGSGSWAATAARSRRRTSTRWPRAALRYNNMHTTALCSPSRVVHRHRPQPPQQRHGRDHRARHRAIPGYNGVDPVRERLPVGDAARARLQHVHGRQVAPDARAARRPPPGRTTAGRWRRGFERFYGFLGGDTSQWYPDLVYDNHQVEPPATPEEGYHLTEDLVDQAIEFIADAKQVDPDKPFYLHLCFGATHAPHHVPKEWADRYAGQFDDGWDAYREQVVRPAEGAGHRARRRRAVPARPGRARLGLAVRAGRAAAVQPDDGGLRRASSATPTTTSGRLLDFLREHGELDNTIVMVISDNGASAEGGPTGTTNEAQFFNNAPEPLEDSLAVIDEIGGPNHFNHYPWGWTWAGNTPFRRWKRETYRGGVLATRSSCHWPAGHQGPRRGPHPVRAHHRHGADRPRPARHRAARHHPRGHPVTAARASASPHTLDDAAAPTRHHTQYFEMLGHRAIYHDGWRAVCPWPGPSFTEAGVGFGQPDHGREARPSSTPPAGSSTTSTRTSPRTTTSPSEHRDKLIELIATVVRRGRQVRRAADRRQRAGPHGGGEAAGRRAARPLHLPAGHPVGPVLRRPRACSTGRTASPPTSRSRTAAPRACCSARAPRPAATRCSCKDGRLHYVHNYVGRSLHQVSSPDPLPAGEHELRFEFEPTGAARPGPRAGAHPAGCSSTSTARSSPRAEAPVTTPFVLNPGALTCGANPGSPVTPDYPSPFRFTGTLHTRHRRRVRRPHHRQRERDAHGDGPAVAATAARRTG